MKNILTSVILAVIVVSALIAYKVSVINTNEAVMGVKTKSADSSMINAKPISKDDSFASIDLDLNNTVIVSENFSDL